MIIFESTLTTFEANFIFWGSWGSIKNWLELKIEPLLADLARVTHRRIKFLPDYNKIEFVLVIMLADNKIGLQIFFSIRKVKMSNKFFLNADMEF